jgi:hypothetical protein
MKVNENIPLLEDEEYLYEYFLSRNDGGYSMPIYNSRPQYQSTRIPSSFCSAVCSRYKSPCEYTPPPKPAPKWKPNPNIHQVIGINDKHPAFVKDMFLTRLFCHMKKPIMSHRGMLQEVLDFLENLHLIEDPFYNEVLRKICIIDTLEMNEERTEVINNHFYEIYTWINNNVE